MDTRPSHGKVWRGGHGHSYGHGHGKYHYPRYSWSFGFYGYYPNYWWGAPYWGPRYGYYSPVVYASRPSHGMGALDLNVRPKTAEVYVNGQYVGLARQYDGFPAHLWLDRGIYEVALYRPGYETVVREFEVFTGLVIDVDIDMRPGEAVQPVRSERAERAAPAGDAWDYRDPGTWDRGESRRSSAPDAVAQVELRVFPEDSSVYLDGRFLGTGGQLTGLAGALQVGAGEHTLEVLHPDYQPETVRFVAELGRAAVVDVRLDPRS